MANHSNGWTTTSSFASSWAISRAIFSTCKEKSLADREIGVSVQACGLSFELTRSFFFFFGVTGPPGLGDVELHRAVAHSKFARHLATRCCRCVMYKGRESSAAFFVHSTDTFDPRTFPTCICNRLRGTLISDCQRTHTTTVVYLSSPDITHPPLLAKHAPHRAHPCSMLRRSSDSQLPLSLCRPQERLHGGL